MVQNLRRVPPAAYSTRVMTFGWIGGGLASGKALAIYNAFA